MDRAPSGKQTAPKAFRRRGATLTRTGLRGRPLALRAHRAPRLRDLTISGPVGSGTYLLVSTITIHGTSTWNGVTAPGDQQVGVAAVEWTPDGTTQSQNLPFDATVPSFSQTVQMQGIPFQPGTPFDFMAGLLYIGARFPAQLGSHQHRRERRFPLNHADRRPQRPRFQRKHGRQFQHSKRVRRNLRT